MPSFSFFTFPHFFFDDPVKDSREAGTCLVLDGEEQLAFFEVYACLKRLYSVVASLTYGPETLGMRPAAGAIMRRQLGASKRVYDLLLDRTGITVPEVEEIVKDAEIDG